MSLLRKLPLTTGLVAGATVLALVLGTGLLPVPCLLRSLTGLDCPFCGGSRMIGALLRVDLPTALSLNAFALLVVVPLALVLLVGTARYELGRTRRVWPAGTRGKVLAFGLTAAAVAWGVVRNLPLEPFTVLSA